MTYKIINRYNKEGKNINNTLDFKPNPDKELLNYLNELYYYIGQKDNS